MARTSKRTYRAGRCHRRSWPCSRSLLWEFELEEGCENVLDRRAVVVDVSIRDADGRAFVDELVAQPVIVVHLRQHGWSDRDFARYFPDNILAVLKELRNSCIRVLA